MRSRQKQQNRNDRECEFTQKSIHFQSIPAWSKYEYSYSNNKKRKDPYSTNYLDLNLMNLMDTPQSAKTTTHNLPFQKKEYNRHHKDNQNFNNAKKQLWNEIEKEEKKRMDKQLDIYFGKQMENANVDSLSFSVHPNPGLSDNITPQQISESSSNWVQENEQISRVELLKEKDSKQPSSISNGLNQAFEIKQPEHEQSSEWIKEDTDVLALLDDSKQSFQEQSSQNESSIVSSIAGNKTISLIQNLTETSFKPKQNDSKSQNVESLKVNPQQIKSKLQQTLFWGTTNLWLKFSSNINILEVTIRDITLNQIECSLSLSQTEEGIRAENSPIETDLLVKYVQLCQIQYFYPLITSDNETVSFHFCTIKLPEKTQVQPIDCKTDLSFIKKKTKQKQKVPTGESFLTINTLKLRCNYCKTSSVVPVSSSDNSACLSCRNCHEKMEIKIEKIFLQ